MSRKSAGGGNPARNAEEAGGEVTFAPIDRRTSEPMLLASSGLFWRRLKDGEYYERWQEYEAWSVEPGDAVLLRDD